MYDNGIWSSKKFISKQDNKFVLQFKINVTTDFKTTKFMLSAIVLYFHSKEIIIKWMVAYSDSCKSKQKYSKT
mgnify:CR=1 FL=1